MRFLVSNHPLTISNFYVEWMSSKTSIVAPITTGGNLAWVAGFTLLLVGVKIVREPRSVQPRLLNLVARKVKKVRECFG